MLRQKDQVLEVRAAELQLKETAITTLTEALVEKDTLLEPQKDALCSTETALEERGASVSVLLQQIEIGFS